MTEKEFVKQCSYCFGRAFSCFDIAITITCTSSSDTNLKLQLLARSTTTQQHRLHRHKSVDLLVADLILLEEGRVVDLVPFIAIVYCAHEHYLKI